MQKVQTELNVFLNTPQSNTRQDYANANEVNAWIFLSVKKQTAFRSLVAQESMKNQINKILQNDLYLFSSKLDFDMIR